MRKTLLPILIRLGMRLIIAEKRKWEGKENTLIVLLQWTGQARGFIYFVP